MNAAGLDEAGIDGGGIFREFLSELLKTGFDPNRGLFLMTTDRLLYPNPQSVSLMDKYTKHYFFLGRMLGKVRSYHCQSEFMLFISSCFEVYWSGLIMFLISTCLAVYLVRFNGFHIFLFGRLSMRTCWWKFLLLLSFYPKFLVDMEVTWTFITWLLLTQKCTGRRWKKL